MGTRVEEWRIFPGCRRGGAGGQPEGVAVRLRDRVRADLDRLLAPNDRELASLVTALEQAQAKLFLSADVFLHMALRALTQDVPEVHGTMARCVKGWIAERRRVLERYSEIGYQLRSVLIDPELRDAHLVCLDWVLLRELGEPGPTLRELTARAALGPGGVAIAPAARMRCPRVWRWLVDARSRGLVRASDPTPDMSSRWTLAPPAERTDPGARTDKTMAHLIAHEREHLHASRAYFETPHQQKLWAAVGAWAADLEIDLQAAANTLRPPVPGFEVPRYRPSSGAT